MDVCGSCVWLLGGLLGAPPTHAHAGLDCVGTHMHCRCYKLWFAEEPITFLSMGEEQSKVQGTENFPTRPMRSQSGPGPGCSQLALCTTYCSAREGVSAVSRHLQSPAKLLTSFLHLP